jgi:glycosyltransferase involved in cell wall biosynthesis
MRVVLSNNYYSLRGGAERVFFDEMNLLARRGIEVIPYSQGWPDNEDTDYAQWFLPGENYSTLAGAPWSKKVRQGVRIVYSSVQRKRFDLFLNQFQPDLLHAHNIDRGLTLSTIDAARARQIPCVRTLHDLKMVCPSYLMQDHGAICQKCLDGKYWRCVGHRCHKNSFAASLVVTAEAYFSRLSGAYGWVSRLIAPSRFVLDKHVQGGVPQEKLAYLPNGVDPTQYAPNADVGAYVLYVGRLSQEKGIPTLLRSLQATGIPLRVAGTGPAEETYRGLVVKEGFPDIEFCGHCAGGELTGLYQNASFVVLPSECYENAPMSVLEAFAHGKPVLGSHCGGIPELVLDGITGLLFEAGSVEDLREKLVWMWNHRTQVVQMGKRARKRVEREFCMERHINGLLEIYRSVLG